MVAEGPIETERIGHSQREFSLSWHDADHPMAYVVDNAALLKALCHILFTRPVTVLQPTTVTSHELVAGKVRLNCDDLNVPDFDLVIACDGAQSQLVSASRLRKYTSVHQQTAIVGSLAHGTPPRQYRISTISAYRPYRPDAIGQPSSLACLDFAKTNCRNIVKRG